MLVLSRQRDESIMIGDNVVVTIVDIRGDKVRLGIEYPMHIPVHRQEVYEAIQRENARDATRPGFMVSTTGSDKFGLKDIFQRFASEQWVASHMTPEQSAAAVLDSFKRAVAGELELLDVKDVR